MKSLVVIGLFGVGLIAIWKHHAHAMAVKTPATDIPSGVSQYDPTPASQTPDQLLATLPTNSNAVSEPGFSAAFGPNENQPTDDENLW